MRPSLAGLTRLAAVGLLALSALTLPVQAQDGWIWPWEEPQRGEPPPQTPPPKSSDPDAGYMRPSASTAPADDWQSPDAGRNGFQRAPDGYRNSTTRAPAEYQEGPAFAPAVGVERTDLAPVMAGDGSGLPYELWRGLDIGTLEKLLAAIEIPPRSHALHGLWRRLMTADLRAGVGAGSPEESLRFEAVRIEVLYRSGLTADAARLLGSLSQAAESPAITVLLARSAIAEGRDDEACGQTQKFLGDLTRLPQMLAGEAVLISGYCVARSGNAAAAGIAAGFAREQGIEERAGLAALDAIAHGTKPALKEGTPVSLIDYRLLAKAGFTDTARIIPSASPALLVALSRDPKGSAQTRLAAGEAAARLYAIETDALAELYRAASMSNATEPNAPAFGAPNSPASTASPVNRAVLFFQTETEQEPSRKARAIRHYLDEARRADLYMPALRTMSTAVRALRPASDLGWFAETAIEVLLAADDPQAARAWLGLGASHNPGVTARLGHWRALIDISDTASALHDQSLTPIEDLASRGGFAPDQLHRIATVLDALGYQIPIPLWEAASRTPQPSSGHLPETGLLSRLQEAAKAKEFGRTTLLAMNALGPEGAEGAHMIALGDAIRALRNAGLEAEARQLGFEALFPAWPRQVSG